MPVRRKTWFAVHRWIALVVSLQLLAWSVGGFVFSVLDIEDVRGETDAVRELPELPIDRIHVSLRNAIQSSETSNCAKDVTRVIIAVRQGRPVYRLRSDQGLECVIDATTGEVLGPISSDDASKVALADFAHEANVGSVTLIETNPPNEYRGGELPAYQVVLDHPREPHIYVSAMTGDVTKRRNKLWRTFDFFWMLHIMDYRERESFNHVLLTGMSLLAILTSLSGLLLWWWRVPRLWSRQRRLQSAG